VVEVSGEWILARSEHAGGRLEESILAILASRSWFGLVKLRPIGPLHSGWLRCSPRPASSRAAARGGGGEWGGVRRPGHGPVGPEPRRARGCRRSPPRSSSSRLPPESLEQLVSGAARRGSRPPADLER